MKATIKQMFNETSRTLNARVNSISSLGEYVSPDAQTIVDKARANALTLVSPDSLAYKILDSQRFDKSLSDKQLYVISYELLNNVEYSEEIAKSSAAEAAAANRKADEHKAKLADNKSNSQSVLDFVKSNGKLLKDYYSFLRGNKKLAREFFSKKFTMESATQFINL